MILHMCKRITRSACVLVFLLMAAPVWSAPGCQTGERLVHGYFGVSPEVTNLPPILDFPATPPLFRTTAVLNPDITEHVAGEFNDATAQNMQENIAEVTRVEMNGVNVLDENHRIDLRNSFIGGHWATCGNFRHGSFVNFPVTRNSSAAV